DRAEDSKPPRPTASLQAVPEAGKEDAAAEAPASPQVVSLDAFRRRPPGKD
ncbi:MAG: hypothetical protein JOY63_11915, partial [Acetobacteraceae bacterium]|nr:hypothetical protein [Acetobacteraceae bacterium]